MANPQIKNFTPEEIAAITSLPIGEFPKRDDPSDVVKGYYDRSQYIFYPIDDDGNLAGLALDMVRKKSSQQNPRDRDEDPDGTGSDDEGGANDSDEEDDGRRVLSARAIILIAVIVLLIAAALAFFLLVRPRLRSAPAPVPAPEIAEAVELPEDTNLPDESLTLGPGSSSPTEHAEAIVQTVRNVHRGEQVTEDMVNMITVSAEEYNQLILSGINPVKWEDIDAVMAMYANRFIPAGQYIAVTYLSSASPVPKNPWETVDGVYMTISVPIDALDEDDIPYYGAKGTLYITRQTNVSEPLPAPEPEFADGGEELLFDPDGNPIEPEPTPEPTPKIEGIEVETSVAQSLVVDNFIIDDVVICDILNADGESVYDLYSIYIDMPEVNRRSEFMAMCGDRGYLSSVTPVSLVVRIRTDQAGVVGDFEGTEMSFDIDSSAADGDMQNTVVNGTRLLNEMIVESKTLLDSAPAVPGDEEDAPIIIDPTEESEDITDTEIDVPAEESKSDG